MARVLLDPSGELYGLPAYPWRQAPPGYATRRQLAAQGLRKAGQEPAALLLKPASRVVAYLYRIDRAAPRRPFTAAKRAAVHAAARARQRCLGPCGRTGLGYIPPKRTDRQCWDCWEKTS